MSPSTHDRIAPPPETRTTDALGVSWLDEKTLDGGGSARPRLMSAEEAQLPDRGVRWRLGAVLAVLVGCLLWSYWPTIADLQEFWTRNDDYSAGQLVPIVAMYLCWRERRRFGMVSTNPFWGGVGIVVLAQACRFFGLWYEYGSIENYSLVLTIAGLVLLVGGRQMFRQSRWILALLLLMVPVPQRIHEAVALPLQGTATGMAAFALDILGFFVTREGNILRIDGEAVVAVTEACSGLRMVTAFILVTAVFAFLVRRPPWQKALLLASSVPIALFTNALRLVATSVFVVHTQDPSYVEIFHDYAGLIMMPVAVGLIILEVYLFSGLFGGQHTRPTETVAYAGG